MFKCVIFDLDGVIVSTDEYHYQAWKSIADREGIPFDRKVNERLRGVSRMESLEILLEKSDKEYSAEEKNALAEQKNRLYNELLDNLSPKDILPGVLDLLSELKKRDIKAAIGSSSKNTVKILQKIGLDNSFEAIADGNGIKNSKPDPEVFLLAAGLSDVNPKECVVVEDAIAGIDAALAAGSRAVAVGYAADYEKADYAVQDLTALTLSGLLGD